MDWIVKKVWKIVYSNPPPLNANFYACIIYLFIKYIDLIYKYMGFD